MRQYVLGFAFSPTGDRVVLIEKKRPDWQLGKLNGVGGRVENGEKPVDAMVREFKEETGVDTTRDDWRYFGLIVGEGVQVILFKSFEQRLVREAMTVTDEFVAAFRTDILGAYVTIPNVPGLIGLARDPQNPLITVAYGMEVKAG
jgi:8-oxo-dGTP diphosphatase